MGKPLQQSRNEINTMIDRTETMCGFQHLTRPKSFHLRIRTG